MGQYGFLKILNLSFSIVHLLSLVNFLLVFRSILVGVKRCNPNFEVLSLLRERDIHFVGSQAAHYE